MFVEKLLKLTEQLYPTGRAFRLHDFNEKIHKALAISESKAYEDALNVLDSALPDNLNFTSDDATAWEKRLGLISNNFVELEDRKLAIKRKLNHPGTVKTRQSYLYLEGQLRAAGFDVRVYENRFANAWGPELVVNGDFSDLSGGIVQGWKYSNGSNIPSSQVAFGSLNTVNSGTNYKGPDITLNFSKTYKVEFYKPATGGLYLRKFFNGSTIGLESTFSNGTITFYITGAQQIFFEGGSFEYIDNVSVKEQTWGTKTPFEVTGGTGGRYIQHGEIQHGTHQHGNIFTNIIANHIDEELDQTFGTGSNLKSTFFIAGDTIDTVANIPESRKAEFRQLVLRIKPVQTVAFLNLEYIS